jgi:Mg2+/Co2+ transporter CorC
MRYKPLTQGYRSAVQWIASNDAIGDFDSAEELVGLVTVAMVADLFDKDQEQVAKDVWKLAEGAVQ